ncbi:MAG: hypothetical protein M1828_007664 [Chrysothrix sp. TS-e1954]|nr:MAG: hypothetical protein M1828_007664 [Chrysothrix sp. TS-e1954]
MKLSHTFLEAAFLALLDCSRASAAAVPAAASSSRTIVLPSSQPSNAPRVPANFPAFGIDERELIPYAGGAGKPNQFSNNLIHSVNSRTGAASVIRIGGTAGDFVTFNASQSEPVSSTGFTVGPSWFQSYKNFGDNKITIQVKLGDPSRMEGKRDLPNTLEYASRAYNAVTMQNLDAIEIGNEASAYDDGKYTPAAYASAFLRYGNAIAKRLGLASGLAIFQACDTASMAAMMGRFTPVEIFEAGVNKNGLVKTASEHYYQSTTAAKTSLGADLMNHEAIVSRLEPYKESIQYVRNEGIPFILGEVGNGDIGGANLTFQAVLGSALWAVDFQMYAMSLGISRVTMTNKVNAGFSLWQPTTTGQYPAAVRAPYYAQPFIADFIGKSGATHVQNHNIALPGGKGPDPYLSAYGGYESRNLARIAIVNLHLWSDITSAANSGPRPTVHTHLKVNKAVGSTVAVERLTAPHGAYASAQQGITWAGEQWDYSPDLGKGRIVDPNHTETVKVQKGTDGNFVLVGVKSSEAVIVRMV